MDNKDEFGFDNLDTGFDDSGDSLDEFEVNGGFDDFSSDNNDNDSKKGLIKTALIMIGVGIAIVIVGILLSSLLNSAADGINKKKPKVNNEQNTEVVNSTNNVDSNNTQNTGSASSNSWIQFSSTTDDIKFADDIIESTFTITGIKHYVKKASDSGDNIAIKTILTGNLSGFIGAYDLEIPYSKGQKLNIGVSFKVSVQYGVYGDRTVIGEIEY